MLSCPQNERYVASRRRQRIPGLRVTRMGLRKSFFHLKALRSRPLSALATTTTFEEEYETSVALGNLCQLTTLTTSALPNGVTLTSTGAAASAVIGVLISGIGTADSLPGASFAAKTMAFKSAHSKSDLAIQRALELDAITPHARCLPHALFIGCEGLPETAHTMASAVAAAIDRDPYVPWEFNESLLPPSPKLDTVLQSAVLSAAYGEGQPIARPAATKASLSALSSTLVDEVVANCVATQAIAVVGIGLDHATLLSAATPGFATLPSRSLDTIFPTPAFVPGGFASKTMAHGAAIAIAYPQDDPFIARIFAAALGAKTLPGLVVLEGKAKAELHTDAMQLLTIDDFTDAINSLKTTLFSTCGIELAVQVATGSDPTTVASKLDAYSNATLKDAAQRMLAVEPALALVSPPQDDF